MLNKFNKVFKISQFTGRIKFGCVVYCFIDKVNVTDCKFQRKLKKLNSKKGDVKTIYFLCNNI